MPYLVEPQLGHTGTSHNLTVAVIPTSVQILAHHIEFVRATLCFGSVVEAARSEIGAREFKIISGIAIYFAILVNWFW